MHSGCSRPLRGKDSEHSMEKEITPRMKRPLSVTLLFLTIAACSRESTPPQAAGKSPSQPPGTRGGSVAEARPSAGATEIGDTMPAYSGKLLDGSDFQLAQQKDKVVLINVWATWCGPCRFEVPELEALHKQFSASGLKIIGISVDEGGEDTVKQFVAEHKMTYAVAVDPEGRIANLLQTTVLPTTVLIDRNGKIVWRQVGALPPNDPKLRAALDSALKGGKKG